MKVRKKAYVIAASKLGRVCFRCVPSADAEQAEPFVRDYVEPATRVVTDGLPTYTGWKAAGFDPHPFVMARDLEGLRQQLHHVRLVVSLLNRWFA
ncbi:MAG: hypothetical protein EPN23_05940 [Verrucomicrobia bacterium]|nr:MAG: hypothetical protein EPN23_05940 [Verrucomicrobiota bacterium]